MFIHSSLVYLLLTMLRGEFGSYLARPLWSFPRSHLQQYIIIEIGRGNASIKKGANVESYPD